MADDFLKSSAEKARDLGEGPLAESELARYARLKTYRDAVFTPSWQTLSQYFQPNMSDINTDKTEGNSGWSDRVFDTTAIEAARTCTTGQSNWATPSTEPWFQWSPPKALNLEDSDDAAIWTALCTEIALDELARSNYYRMSGQQYKSRTVFGTGQMHIEEGKSRLINCSTRKIGTYCIAKNDEDEVDTVYSEFKLSARAAAQKFGEDNLSPKVKKALEENGGKGQDTEFSFLHVIRPREELEREPGKKDGRNKPIASIYVAIDDKWVVRNSGYDEMPDSVTNFDDWGTGSVWGYSPAFETLPNVRQLNYITRFSDAQVELLANPRILEPIGLWGQVDLRPGGRTAFDPNLEGGGKPEEWMTQANLATTEKSIEYKANGVKRMFYADVFAMLQQIERKMTAYELAQRIGEKLEQLSPMFSRIITEKTTVDLKRIFGILFRAGKFPPPPRSMFVPIDGTNRARLAMPEVTYTSRLALALKSLQNKATMDTMQFVSEFSINTGKPELLDNWDLDAMLRTYAINQGMSSRFERPRKDVASLRAGRAKQMAAQAAMSMAEQASKAAKNMGGAPEAMQQQVQEQVSSANAAA